MFVKFGRAGRGRLWLIAPGADPRPTQYRVGAPTQYDWHVR
jgi:nucleotidyltransferase/DNA polymerase involved in DNA repair